MLAIERDEDRCIPCFHKSTCLKARWTAPKDNIGALPPAYASIERKTLGEKGGGGVLLSIGNHIFSYCIIYNIKRKVDTRKGHH